LIHFKYDFDTSGAAAKGGVYFTQSGKEGKAAKFDFQDFCCGFVYMNPLNHGGTETQSCTKIVFCDHSLKSKGCA